MKRLGQKICVAVVLSLAFVAIWHDSAKAAMPVITSIGQIKENVIGPHRIDVDAMGTIYLNDPYAKGVTRYNKYGQALPTLKGDYKITTHGLAVTPDGRRVYVSVVAPGQSVPTAVAVLDGSTGALLGYLGAGFNEFKQAMEIDLDGDGNIYVGNYERIGTQPPTAQIKVYNGSTYGFRYSFGAPTPTLVLPLPGQFGEIAGLTVDIARKEVLVAEGWNNNGISRVQIFGLDGTFKRLLPEAIIAGIQVNCKPSGLTVDPSGRIYMLSMLTSTVHVFTADSLPPLGATGTDVYLGKFTKGTPDPAYDPVTGKVFLWGMGMITTPAHDTIFDPLTGRLFVVTDGNGVQIFGVDNYTVPVKTNVAPETPIMLAPVQGGKVATSTPTLQWAAAVDADGDALTYNVQIVALNGTAVSAQSNVAATSLSVAAGTLLENNSYGWKVQAADAELTSSYSAVESFWINAVEEAPGAALLGGPAPAATVNKDTVFSCQATTALGNFFTFFPVA